jgi:hypothetical protein
LKRLLRLTYPLIIWTASTLVAVAYVVTNDGFGKGDIKGFSIITLIFSLISLSLYGLLSRLFSRFNSLVSLLLTIITSALQAVIFIYTTWFIFGPWIGAFSFPIIYCWLTGTVLGNFYILLNSHGSFKPRHFAILTGLVIIVLTSFYLVNVTKDSLSENQNLDIICLTWTPSDENPETNHLTKFSLTESEANDILSLGLKGTFWADKYFRIENSKLISTDFPDYDFDNKDSGLEINFMFGNKLDSIKNERKKVIIIMNHPQETSYSFKQPLDKSLIVVQSNTNNEFKIYPDNIKTNIKTMTIEGTDFRSFPHWTSIKVELKGRGDFSIHGFQWIERQPSN